MRALFAEEDEEDEFDVALVEELEEECMCVAEVLVKLLAGLIAVEVVIIPLLLVKIMCPGSEIVRLTATFVPRFSSSINVASLASSVKLFDLVCWVFEDTVIGMDLARVVVWGTFDVTTVMRPFDLVVSASKRRRAPSGGAGTTNEDVALFIAWRFYNI